MKNPARYLLTICLLISFMRTSALAAPDSEHPTGISGEAVWTLKNDTMYISGQGVLSGVSNADCQPWEYFEDQIRHIVVEDGVTVLGDTVFAHTYNLETVTIADSVTEICEGAFRNCYALKTVKFPANLQILGNFAFAYCEKMESAELPDSLTTMGGSVFAGCTALANLRLPNSLYDIQQMNFDSCTALTEVTIPAGTGFLRHAAFQNCSNLTKVVFNGDQPHTNGDPFYMCPEDLVVHCYNDTQGWDAPLFYTYPVVKLDRPSNNQAENKTESLPAGADHTADPPTGSASGMGQLPPAESPPSAASSISEVNPPSNQDVPDPAEEGSRISLILLICAAALCCGAIKIFVDMAAKHRQ